MLLLRKLLVWAVHALALSRRALVLENRALRHQLATLAQRGRRPRLRPADRLFWVALRCVWSDWTKTLAIVRPATVVGWHRRAFRVYWRRISRPRGRPRTEAPPRNLIRRMATENHWGVPRIPGELLKLGFRVSERTVSRYVRMFRPRRPPSGSWKSFLDNHREVLAAMDLFIIPTLTFRILYVFFVIHHDRRTLLHVNVMAHPTAAWVRQQLREAFPFERAPRYLLMDRDAIFSAEVATALKHMEVTPVRARFQSLWQKGSAEGWVGSCRRELLDYGIELNKQHLLRLVRAFLDYYHDDRTHLSLGKDPPTTRAVCSRRSPSTTVVSLPRVGGLHHRYEWRNAA